MSEYHEIVAAARQLRAAVTAMPSGPQKTAMREASEAMIDTIRDTDYTLHYMLSDRRELPDITNAPNQAQER